MSDDAQHASLEEDLVRYIVENLVNDPDEIRLTRRTKGRTIILKLNVAPDDMGRIIGKSGQVANSIRALLRASNHGRRRVVLDIE